MMRRCPSIYTTQEAEPQSDPAHITLVCKYHQRFFDILMLLKNSPVFLLICCVFRSPGLSGLLWTWSAVSWSGRTLLYELR